jgi:leukotriene-A4 hydrolase
MRNLSIWIRPAWSDHHVNALRVENMLTSLLTFTSYLPLPYPPSNKMTRDNATLSNYHQVRNLHTHLDWSIDWQQQLISGRATLTLKPESKTAVNEVVLDTSFLDVTRVTVDGESAEWEKADRIEAMGEALTVRLKVPKLEEVRTGGNATYSTLTPLRSLKSRSSIRRPRSVPRSAGSRKSTLIIHFWDVADAAHRQTKGGKHPYLYSQSQAVRPSSPPHSPRH